MDFSSAALILGIFNSLLIICIGILIYKERNYLKDLFPKNGARDIRNKFREVIESINYFDSHATKLDKDLVKLREDLLGYVQNVSVSRYNPYGDTGGDQSFSVSLLDGRATGFIITSLHSRSGTRVYIKGIKQGKSDLDLSKEEKEVLQNVLKDQV